MMKIVAEAKTPEDFRAHYLDVRRKAHEHKLERNQKFIDSIRKADESPEALHDLFDLLVPSSGPSKYKGGELVRAMMRILYRDYNDGDVFYRGYGVETCADAAAFISEKIPATFSIFEDTAQMMLEDDAYTRKMQQVADFVVDKVTSNAAESAEPNTEDFQQYDGEEWLEENGLLAMYELTVDYPEEIIAHLEAGNIDARDIEEMISDNCSNSDDLDVTAHEEYAEVNNLSYEDYELLEDYCNRWMQQWAEELTDEYGDPEEEE